MKTTADIIVRGYHIDHFGHVNHARYVELLEEARWRYLEDNNLLEPIHRIGALHVVAKIVVQYMHPARAGDTLRFKTQIKTRSDHSFELDQQAYLNGSEKLVVQATITNVFINSKGRPRLIDKDILGIWPDLVNAVKGA